MTNTSQDKSFLRFKSARIYFIYSFFMDIGSLDQLFEGPKVKSLFKGLKQKDWHQNIPESRRGVTINLNVKKRWENGEFYSMIYKEQKGKIEGFSDIDKYPYKDIEFEVLTRIFDTGAGTVTIKLSLEDLTSLGIHYIFNLADVAGIQDKKEQIPTLKIKNKEEKLRLFDLFKNAIKTIEKPWSDENFVDMGEKSDWQNPYVVTVGTLKGKASSDQDYWWNHSLEKLKKNQTYEKCLEAATLLFRFLKGREYISLGHQKNIWIPPELQGKGTFLRNYSWHRDLFIGFHPRASLIVKYEEGDGMGASKILVNSLVNLMELIRSRWHISIAINALLDQDIEMLKNYPSEDNLVFLQSLIERRKQFALFLSDPISYSFEGGTIGDINEVGRREFFLDDLKEMTFKKFEAIDRLYEDQMKFVRIKTFDEDILKDLGGKIEKKSI